MIFFENSREININLENYLKFNFEVDSLDSPPLPLIFNLEKIEETDLYLDFEPERNYSEYAGELAYTYCLLNESKCDYLELDFLILIKGEQYKIKMNAFEENDNYYFSNYTFYCYNIKIINNGPTFFKSKENIIINYFVDIRQYENFYIYFNSNLENITISLYNFSLDNYTSDDFIVKANETNQIENKRNREMMSIVMPYEFKEDYNGFLYVFSDLYSIKNEKTIQIENGKYALIEKIKDIENEYILESSNKNIALFNPNFDEINTMSMVLFRNDKYENEKELIFIDSTNEYTSLNYYILENKIDKNNKQFSFNLVSNNDLNFFFE
jgi:hypothetical protein